MIEPGHRFGRRMPYILFRAPICAVLFALIPQMPSLWTLMLVIIIFNLIVHLAGTHDHTNAGLYSRQPAEQGVINLMGGIASIIAFLIGGSIAHSYGRGATFLMGSVVMLIAVVVLSISIRETKLNPMLLVPLRDRLNDETPAQGKTDESAESGGGKSSGA